MISYPPLCPLHLYFCLNNTIIKDLVVIVTGGARGIGKGIVLTYERNSAYIVIADVNKDLGLRRKRFTFARLFCSFFKPMLRKNKTFFIAKSG